MSADFKEYSFELDEFQKKAIKAVENNHSVIVSAPTGTGKTVIAEYLINKCLSEGTNVIYTAPIKALSNQKFRQFQTLFANKTGIITGDVNINPSAPLLIMTTEIFHNRILENPDSFSLHNWIIFDEIHYLDDLERGTVWEECLIFLPIHMRFIGLSATIPNIVEFSTWLKQIHYHPLEIVREFHRKIPLHFLFQCYGKIFDKLEIIRKIAYGKRKTIVYSKKNDSKVFYFNKLSPKNRPQVLINHLFKSRRIPGIYFSFSRRKCEYLAEKAAKIEFLSAERKKPALNIYDHLSDRFNITGDERTKKIRFLIEKGVAYHHAGIHPLLKEIIEQLFAEKFIQMIFTTETFALGINMPVKSVIIDELRKKYGRFFKRLRTRDFYQMAGRAGRRGIDKEGFVYTRINPEEINLRELKDIFEGKPEPIRSRFNASYATILNLYENHQERLLDVYSLSFHRFQENKRQRSLQLEQLKSKLHILKQLRYIERNRLTSKGQFAKKIHGYELPLSELFSQGIIEKLSFIQLGILCLAMVYEPRPGTRAIKLNRETRSLKIITERIVKMVHRLEKRKGISPRSKNFFYDLSFPLVQWMKNKSFSQIMGFVDQDEGEVIRFYRMSIQILREMLATPVSISSKEKISRAIDLINRGVIDAETQLKNVINVSSIL